MCRRRQRGRAATSRRISAPSAVIAIRSPARSASSASVQVAVVWDVRDRHFAVLGERGGRVLQVRRRRREIVDLVRAEAVDQVLSRGVGHLLGLRHHQAHDLAARHAPVVEPDVGGVDEQRHVLPRRHRELGGVEDLSPLGRVGCPPIGERTCRRAPGGIPTGRPGTAPRHRCDWPAPAERRLSAAAHTLVSPRRTRPETPSIALQFRAAVRRRRRGRQQAQANQSESHSKYSHVERRAESSLDSGDTGSETGSSPGSCPLSLAWQPRPS